MLKNFNARHVGMKKRKLIYVHFKTSTHHNKKELIEIIFTEHNKIDLSDNAQLKYLQYY